MSYDISLMEPDGGNVVYFDKKHRVRGGTYEIGGSHEAWLNITYNYSSYYYERIDSEKGIRWLYGRTGKECIPVLKKAIAELGTDIDSDYWKPTPGNAGASLVGLLQFAKARPDGVFAGD